MVMDPSYNSSIGIGCVCVCVCVCVFVGRARARRGTCAKKAETKAILNPFSGLVDRLMLCSWQQRSKVKKPKNITCTAARMIKRVVTFAFANVQ